MAFVFTSRKILRLAGFPARLATLLSQNDLVGSRHFCNPAPVNCQSQPSYVLFGENFANEEMKTKFLNDMVVHEDYVTPEEENCLVSEIEPVLKRMRYEKNHWDCAITGYRETEKPNWDEWNTVIIERTKELVFKPGAKPLKCVHVLDLKADGVIKPHVDSIKFCGDTIAGISLLTDSVMRMALCEDKTCFIDVLLKRGSLYIMTGVARYDFTHEILPSKNTKFGEIDVVKKRRISIIFRNEP